MAARDCGVARVVYATSSSVYGDDPVLPKKEEAVGEPLSPYAVTTYVNELDAKTFARAYGLETVGLRYFNVFGPRQDPDGPYAAVIPKWIRLLLQGRPCTIYGDGTSSRDFCCIANVVQANVLGATTHEQAAINRVYNIALGRGTTLLQLTPCFNGGWHGTAPALPNSRSCMIPFGLEIFPTPGPTSSTRSPALCRPALETVSS